MTPIKCRDQAIPIDLCYHWILAGPYRAYLTCHPHSTVERLYPRMDRVTDRLKVNGCRVDSDPIHIANGYAGSVDEHVAVFSEEGDDRRFALRARRQQPRIFTDRNDRGIRRFPRHVAEGGVFTPDPAIVGAGLVREGGRSRAVEALTIVRS